MSEWAQGYVSDLIYMPAAVRQMAPIHLFFALLTRGFAAPDITGTFSYAELGAGFGFGTQIAAAIHPTGRFFIEDFNPAHIAEAAGMVQRAGLANVVLTDAAFDEWEDADLQSSISSAFTGSGAGSAPRTVRRYSDSCGDI